MARYCTPVLHFHLPAARENIASHITLNSHPSNNIYVCICSEMKANVQPQSRAFPLNLQLVFEL